MEPHARQTRASIVADGESITEGSSVRSPCIAAAVRCDSTAPGPAASRAARMRDRWRSSGRTG